MSENDIDPGRPIEPPPIAALLLCRKDTGHLWPPEGGFVVLEKAILQGHFDCYLDDWAPLAKEKIHTSLLAVAISSNRPRIVLALLKRGADPDRSVVVQGGTRKYPERGSASPLARANRSEEITRMLLEAGASVDLLSRQDPPLYYAIGNAGVVRALLEAGANPLQQGESGTPLSEANRSLPQGHETLRLLRKVASEQLKGKRLSSLRCKAGKTPVLPSEARGVRGFLRDWLGETPWNWSICFVRASRSNTSQAIHELFDGSELRAPAKTAVLDEGRPIFVVELKGMPWTIVFDEIGARFHDQRLLELSRSLSEKLACEVLGFGLWQGQHHSKGKLLEWNNTDWDPEHAIMMCGKDLSNGEMSRIEMEKIAEVDAWFASRDVFLPKARFVSDGLVLTLHLDGIKRKEVVGHDVVLTTEYGNTSLVCQVASVP